MNNETKRQPATFPEGATVIVPKFADTFTTDERARVNIGAKFGKMAVRVGVYRDVDGAIGHKAPPDHTGLYSTDKRGRFSVGQQFKESTIVVVVIDAVDLDELYEEP